MPVNHKSFFVLQPSPCRVAIMLVVVVVEAELFYFAIETHTLEFNTPIMIMYLIMMILQIQQIDKMVVMLEEKMKKKKNLGAPCTMSSSILTKH